MPIPLSHEQYIRQCESAAYSSRLSPHALHAAEHQLLKLHLTSTQIGAYLSIRNAILRLWTRNPLVSVTSDEAAQCTREPRHVGLAVFAHEWLARNGYINFGCVEILAGTPRKPAHAAPRQTIVVIGAGMSGLSCARHLTALFKQFQEKWTKQRKQQIPQVIVIEGRGRIGGRLYSHPLKHQDSSTFPVKLANTAEIGAQIITGFERGNPLDCILRGQLALHYHTMKDNMVLYDFDGSPIDSKRDRQIQDLFNDILESAAVHGWKSGQTFPAEDQKSLAKTLTNLPGYDAPVLASFLSEATEEKVLFNLPLSLILVSGFASPAHFADCVGLDAILKALILTEMLQMLPPPSVQPTLGEMMDQHVRDYRDTIGLSPQDLRMINWHYANLEYANSVNVHQLSLGGWDQDSGNEFEGRHAEVIGGYSQIPRSLYKQPEPLDVRLHKIVRKVVYTSASDLHKHNASVVCEDGEVLDANYVVSTLPLGVMKHDPTLFDPPLPNWKLGAMSRLGYGLLNKVCVHRLIQRSFFDWM